MALHYSIDGNLVRVRVSAMVGERDFTQLLDELAVAKALRTSIMMTFDKGASLSEIGEEGMTRIRSHFANLLRDAPGPPVKSAWIMGDAEGATVVRLWKTFTDRDAQLGRRVRIFSSEADGLAWLNAPEE